MKEIIKAVLMAIVAISASTAAMAQTTDGTTGATKVKSEVPNGKKGGHDLVCPNCGTKIDLFQKDGHKGRRHRGGHDKKVVDTLSVPNVPPQFPGRPGMMPGAPGVPGDMQKIELPEIGSVKDALPNGTTAFMKDGKQMFNCFGFEYEPIVQKGVIKYKVTGKSERPDFRR